MWREEVGIMEMLLAYIGEYEEFRGWSSWRNVVVDILSCHENYRRLNNATNQEIKLRDTNVQCKEENNAVPDVDLTSGLYSENSMWQTEPCSSVARNRMDSKNEGFTNAWPTNPDYIQDLTTATDDSENEDAKIEETIVNFADNSMPLDSKGTKPHSEIEGQGGFAECSVINLRKCDSEQRRFPCQQCPKAFPHFSALKVHLRSHTGERPYLCEICGKSFTQSGNLKTHLRLHSGEQPFSCQTCGKSFTQRGNLVAHAMTHESERPHKCEICGKSFAYSNSLTYHLRTHQDERPFACIICGKAFSVNGNLIKHIKTHDLCKQPFSSDASEKADVGDSLT